MTAPFRLYGEFEGGEDAADEREAWLVARRQFEDGDGPSPTWPADITEALIEAAKEPKA